MNLRPGTQQHKVYKLLLTHEYMSTDKLLVKSKLTKAGLSSTLTALRRKGLAEYSGKLQQKGGLRWKKHPENKPLFPPQADVLKRRVNSKEPALETYQVVCDRIAADLNKLRWMLKRQQERLDTYEQIKETLENL